MDTHTQETTQPEPPAGLITARQLCRAINICPATLSELRREGLPTIHVGVAGGIGARGVRYLLPDVIAWLKERTARMAPPQE